jgi:phosphocarrier protein HPr
MSRTIELTVLNTLGIHARPAAELVRCARKFASTRITILRDDEVFLSTSILEVLSASLESGARFTVEADGPEADLALEAIAALMIQLREEEQQP